MTDCASTERLRPGLDNMLTIRLRRERAAAIGMVCGGYSLSAQPAKSVNIDNAHEHTIYDLWRVTPIILYSGSRFVVAASLVAVVVGLNLQVRKFYPSIWIPVTYEYPSIL